MARRTCSRASRWRSFFAQQYAREPRHGLARYMHARLCRFHVLADKRCVFRESEPAGPAPICAGVEPGRAARVQQRLGRCAHAGARELHGSTSRRQRPIESPRIMHTRTRAPAWTRTYVCMGGSAHAYAACTRSSLSNREAQAPPARDATTAITAARGYQRRRWSRGRTRTPPRCPRPDADVPDVST
ncbi:hypothetical protein BC834DRAFT_91846 [Gloeopeniophorella convolvens]|nr:hypothetical protein BC834DRAFT_91846 [Gloeopeniophorella convolvens]